MPKPFWDGIKDPLEITEQLIVNHLFAGNANILGFFYAMKKEEELSKQGHPFEDASGGPDCDTAVQLVMDIQAALQNRIPCKSTTANGGEDGGEEGEVPTLQRTVHKEQDGTGKRRRMDGPNAGATGSGACQGGSTPAPDRRYTARSGDIRGSEPPAPPAGTAISARH